MIPKFILKKRIALSIIYIVLLIITLLFFYFDPFLTFKLRIQDHYYLLDKSKKISKDIVIIAIDDKSLSDEELGRWHNWGRKYYGDMVKSISSQSPKVIAFDISFAESTSGISKYEFLSLLKQNITIDDIKKYFLNEVNPEDVYFAEQIKSAIKNNIKIVLAIETKRNKDLFPIEILGMNASALGFANVDPDIDNIVRKVPLFHLYKNDDGTFMYESLSLVTYKLYKNIEFNESDFIYPNRFIKGNKYVIDDLEIPIEDKNKMNINYFGNSNEYTTISFSDAIKGNFVDVNGNKVDLKNKIILVGATAPALQDLRSTPISKGILTPGVEIHAASIQTLLEKKTLEYLPIYLNVLICFVLIFAMILLSRYLSSLFFLIVTIITMFVYYLITTYLFNIGIIIDLFYFYLIAILSYIFLVSYNAILHAYEKSYLKNAFGRYVSKEYVNKILKNPDLLKLGGQKKELTIFFSDIAGFSTFSEKMQPEQLVEFLNEYLTAMTNLIQKYNGTVDKYIGDAIVAFWNAPLDIEDHAIYACDFVLESLQVLDQMRKVWISKGLPDINVRSGINTDFVVVGNMGSSTQFNYTIMGDGVNLASRLEGANKEYNTRILIGENTYEKIKHIFLTREIDIIKVKGKNKPVKIYNLSNKINSVKKEVKEMFDLYTEAYNAYRQKDFNSALILFEKIVLQYNDGPSKTFVQRCNEFIKNPPPADWDGIYVMKTK